MGSTPTKPSSIIAGGVKALTPRAGIELRGDELGIHDDPALRSIVQDWARLHYGNKKFPAPNLSGDMQINDILATHSGIKHARSQAWNTSAVMAMLELPKLLREGKYEGSGVDKHGRSEYVWHDVSVPVKVKGRFFQLHIKLRQGLGGDIFYHMDEDRPVFYPSNQNRSPATLALP